MSMCVKCGKAHNNPHTIFGQSDVCRDCLIKKFPELKIDPQGPGFLPLTDREQQEGMIKQWRDPNYEYYDPVHADKEEAAMNAKYDPNYPTDLSDPDWSKNLPRYTTFGEERTHIPCINWFDNNPFDFLKPKPSKKVTKPKKSKKPKIPYDYPTPDDPWGGKGSDPKDKYDPWKEQNPYDYKSREEYE